MATIFDTRLQSLRHWLNDYNIDCLIVPRVDRYQSEYVAPADDRLAWLSGFTGSAGLALIFKDEAHLFVDGRYTVQAKQEVNSDDYKIHQIPAETPQNFLKGYCQHTPHLTIAYDPWLLTMSDRRRWEDSCKTHQLIPLPENPIDLLWADRPSRPADPIFSLEDTYAGEKSKDKIKKITKQIKEAKAEALILTCPMSICWLLNIRGTDFPCTPVIDAMAIVHKNGNIHLIIDEKKVQAPLPGVTLLDETKLTEYLQQFHCKTIWVDPHQTPVKIIDDLKDSTLHYATDPCIALKAIKNPIEIKGFKSAHIRDGVALTRFLYWIDAYYKQKSPAPQTEKSIAEKLASFREEQELYEGPSFATISGFGSNGAIVHYHASEKSCKILKPGNLLLVDSGGQYRDGTTDVTRTICIGTPTKDHKRHYTLVLKGHIQLATALFPQGTCGVHLDALARLPLWKEGLDYDHGTGHGVGHFLSVHEGPQSISKSLNGTPLQPGMILSNEPGYYKEGHYGIRIENLVLVKEFTEKKTERPLVCFETITLAPLDFNLIETSLLDPAEINWIQNYHKNIIQTLSPHLDSNTIEWLKGLLKITFK